MSKKAIVLGLFAAMLVSQVVGVTGASADVVMWPSLYCSPAAQSVANGEYASFTAYNQNGSGQLTWTAVGGNPSYGYGSSFGTRFYTGSINETRLVSVTDGYQTSTCTVYVYNTYPTPTPTPVSQVYISPQNPYVNSGESVIFTSWGGNGTYSWQADNGNPNSGWGTSFTTRFYNYTDAMLYRDVGVTSGTASAHVWVAVRPYITPTPTPTPYQSLQCSPSYTTANSGDLMTMQTWGGNGTYSWSALDGTPSYGYGSSFSTRFYNYSGYAQNRTVTVTSGNQSAVCTVLVNGSYMTPTVTPIPTNRVEVRTLGRNVTRGQSGENTAVRARGGDTLDLIIRIRSTNSNYLSNIFVTDVLPAGLSYIPRSTTLNGYEVADGITSSGISIGSLAPNTEAAVKFSVRVDGAYVPSWGAVVVKNTANVRADGMALMAVQFPVTMGQNLNVATISQVKTGPADSAWLALLISLLVTGTYAAYTRTDVFGRRTALAEVSRLSRTPGPNFSK